MQCILHELFIKHNGVVRIDSNRITWINFKIITWNWPINEQLARSARLNSSSVSLHTFKHRGILWTSLSSSSIGLRSNCWLSPVSPSKSCIKSSAIFRIDWQSSRQKLIWSLFQYGPGSTAVLDLFIGKSGPAICVVPESNCRQPLREGVIGSKWHLT